ncbi:alpha/beta fold hydrolase [Kitasatospora sp. NBC_00458]|uniref:alpha/beta fold hydrolase n=1 Tax=Kitasatospora sp. NBC_00458 TaxID=2903568 RepID=UPI002E1909EC
MSAHPAADPAADPALAAFLSAYDDALARWPVPTEALDVRTPHGTTRVNACGPRDGRPVVLLHGGGATSACWSANVAALARAGHRVLAVDLIGDPGRSVPSGTPLDVPTADLVGHSYGGWTALRYALHAPARVGRLVLLDPTQCFAGFRPGYLLRVLPLFVPPRTAAKARSYLDWESGGTALDPTWRELYALGYAGFPAARPVTGPRPTRQRLQALTAPVLVLFAERSRTHDAAALADRTRRLLPSATVAVLPETSHHTLPAARPDELNRHLTTFLAPDPDHGPG